MTTYLVQTSTICFGEHITLTLARYSSREVAESDVALRKPLTGYTDYFITEEGN